MLTFFLQKLCFVAVLVVTELVWYMLYRLLPLMDGPATVACVLGYCFGAFGIGYLVYRYVPNTILFIWDKYYDGA